MSELLPPLRFTPIVKPLPWGGRQLERLLGKVLPTDVPCGESWEVVDLPGDQSVVAEGELAAVSLESLVQQQPEHLLGEAPLLQGRFPLLFKFIDAARTLSVQVHPDARAAARLGHGARPKTEAWYVIQAEPEAKLYLGLAEGLGRDELARALAEGRVAEALLAVPAVAGQFYYLPAGLLHAIGAGIVLAEVQLASDTTYRVFDWNRPGLDGRPRPLHVEQALAAFRPELRGRLTAAPPPSGRPGVRCEHFTFERVGLGPGGQVPVEGGRPRMVVCLEGSGELIDTGLAPVALRRGETWLLPACRSAHLASGTGGVFLLVRA